MERRGDNFRAGNHQWETGSGGHVKQRETTGGHGKSRESMETTADHRTMAPVGQAQEATGGYGRQWDKLSLELCPMILGHCQLIVPTKLCSLIVPSNLTDCAY